MISAAKRGVTVPEAMKRILGGVLLLAIICAALLRGGARSRESQSAATVSFSGPTMGTSYTIRLASEPESLPLAALQQRVEARLALVNDQMSTYLPNSEVSRFNRHPCDVWFDVSADTAFVVAAGLEISRLTDGAFDVTVGPLVNLWSFGPDRRPRGIPPEEEIQAAQARVGYADLDVRLDPPALRKRREGLEVDLSAIAKGFAVDAVAGLLDEQGIEHYLVEIGGEVRTRGRRPDAGAWRVGIERPVAGTRQVHCVVELESQALATSGDYRNFFVWQDQTYSHSIDPRTGWPVSRGVASVAVLSDSAMRADAWATAFMVADPDRSWRWAEEAGLDVLMVFRAEQGFRERLTSGFAQAISQNTMHGNTR
jgi:FAD:protein FMN transferase